MTGPQLSVVVTIVDGGEALRRVLDALARQEDPPALEILVPYDASVARETEAIGRACPGVRLLPLGPISPLRASHTPAGQHELYDRRRAAGLAAATGSLVAILEDRGVPRADWARTVLRLHDRPDAVIGGAIECAPCGTLNWACYVSDFGRYGLPFTAGPAAWVSDVNVSYKRSALELTRSLWQDRFHEPVVHQALARRGETLLLSPELVIDHHRPRTPLGALLRERFHWGRLFGHLRSRDLRLPLRLGLAFLGPALPALLLLRHGRNQARRGRLGRFLRAAPAVAMLVSAWTAGEVWGYLTGRP